MPNGSGPVKHFSTTLAGAEDIKRRYGVKVVGEEE